MESENSMRKRQNISDDVDMISHLPETLITHILSFLPTKKAVATKFLSKNWSLRWTELTNFDFDDEDWPFCDLRPSLSEDSEPEKLTLEDFIHFVFLNGAKHVHKLRFRWQNDTSNLIPNHLRLWISTAVSRGVKVLDLTAPPVIGFYRFFLPGELYTSASLQFLRLEGSIFFRVLNVVFLPKLTVLELHRVAIESDESISKLVSGCRILESLTIETDVRWEEDDKEVVFTIPSLTLKRLRICNHNKNSKFELQVDAPALEYFYLRDCQSTLISVKGRLASANEVDLDIRCLISSHLLTGLVDIFCGVRFLKLSEPTVDSLSSCDRLPVILGEVTKLAVQVEISQWSFLVDLIRGCEKLEFLDVECVFKSMGSSYGGDPSYAPKCFSNLKEVIFRGSSCIDEEVHMLKFILKHGSGLKRVFLCHPELKDDTVNEVEEQPRASSDCKLSFVAGASFMY